MMLIRVSPVFRQRNYACAMGNRKCPSSELLAELEIMYFTMNIIRYFSVSSVPIIAKFSAILSVEHQVMLIMNVISK